jgi:hypothetical protein
VLDHSEAQERPRCSRLLVLPASMALYAAMLQICKMLGLVALAPSNRLLLHDAAIAVAQADAGAPTTTTQQSRTLSG